MAMEAAELSLRVFLVDDHEVVRRGFAAILASEPGIEVVGEASSSVGALARIQDTQPDVAVLDLRLSDGDGVSLCREILSRCPEVRCLIVTAFADDETLFAAIMAGASGYLLKEAGANELIEAVRVVGGGGSLI